MYGYCSSLWPDIPGDSSALGEFDDDADIRINPEVDYRQRTVDDEEKSRYRLL